ncbi:hypothetical protein GCM10028821_47310 [Hymenobacter jeollabukensis]
MSYPNPYAAEHADAAEQPAPCEQCGELPQDCSCPRPEPEPDCPACGAYGRCKPGCPGPAGLLGPPPADWPSGEPWGF